jgi:hypothetical protein
MSRGAVVPVQSGDDWRRGLIHSSTDELPPTENGELTGDSILDSFTVQLLTVTSR